MLSVKDEILEQLSIRKGPEAFEGRTTAAFVRVMAASRLEHAIRRSVHYGEPILPPHQPLVQLVNYIARHGEGSADTLRFTYESVCRVIDAHIRLFGKSHRAQTEGFQQVYDDITQDLATHATHAAPVRASANGQPDLMPALDELWEQLV